MLNISCNEIGDEGFAAVASCIDKIDWLEIGYKSIFYNDEDKKQSIDDVIVLCNAIQNRSSPVSKKTICLGIREGSNNVKFARKKRVCIAIIVEKMLPQTVNNCLMMSL